MLSFKKRNYFKIFIYIQTVLKSTQTTRLIGYKDISKKSHINECIDLHTHEMHDEFPSAENKRENLLFNLGTIFDMMRHKSLPKENVP